MESILLKVNAERITEFRTFEEWVNKASSRLGHFSDRHHVLVCLDKEGNACLIGADFMRARDCNRFPVTAFLILRSFDIKENKLPVQDPESNSGASSPVFIPEEKITDIARAYASKAGGGDFGLVMGAYKKGMQAAVAYLNDPENSI
jgi:hypothetical protein